MAEEQLVLSSPSQPECLENPDVVERVNRITVEMLRESLGRLVTAESLPTLTRGIIRSQLEAEYDLPKDALSLRRKEINLLIKALLEDAEAAAADMSAGPAVKKQKTEAPPSPTPSDLGETHSQEGNPSEESDDVTGRSRTVKRGVKHAQAALMTKTYFTENASALDCVLGPLTFSLNPREFSTGSCGWFYGNKHEMQVGEHKVTCQFTINCTVLGSKTWKKGKPRPG